MTALQTPAPPMSPDRRPNGVDSAAGDMGGAGQTCSWAACQQPGAEFEDDAWHCAEHWLMHLAFEREDREPTRRQKYEDTRSRVEALIRDGHRNGSIAQQLGLDISTVYYHRRRVGLVVKQRVAACGTRAGFMRHRDRDETPCAACREAERAYQRERYQRRKRGERAA